MRENEALNMEVKIKQEKIKKEEGLPLKIKDMFGNKYLK